MLWRGVARTGKEGREQKMEESGKSKKGQNKPLGCIHNASVHVNRLVPPYRLVLKSYASSLSLFAHAIGRLVSSLNQASGSSGVVNLRFVQDVLRGLAPFFITKISGPLSPRTSFRRPKVVFLLPSRGQTKARPPRLPRRWGLLFVFSRTWSRQRPW